MSRHEAFLAHCLLQLAIGFWLSGMGNIVIYCVTDHAENMEQVEIWYGVFQAAATIILLSQLVLSEITNENQHALLGRTLLALSSGIARFANDFAKMIVTVLVMVLSFSLFLLPLTSASLRVIRDEQLSTTGGATAMLVSTAISHYVLFYVVFFVVMYLLQTAKSTCIAIKRVRKQQIRSASDLRAWRNEVQNVNEVHKHSWHRLETTAVTFFAGAFIGVCYLYARAFALDREKEKEVILHDGEHLTIYFATATTTYFGLKVASAMSDIHTTYADVVVIALRQKQMKQLDRMLMSKAGASTDDLCALMEQVLNYLQQTVHNFKFCGLDLTTQRLKLLTLVIVGLLLGIAAKICVLLMPSAKVKSLTAFATAVLRILRP
jgi:hypothetical protein